MTKTELAEHQAVRAEVRALVARAGLKAHAEKLDALLKPAVLMTSRAAKAADLEVGHTRLGGCPDLPPKMKWPEGKEGPLLFVLQVRLADVAAFDTEGLLPRDGVLSLFSDPYVDEPTVLHLEGALERKEWAPEEDEPFKACGLDLKPTLQLPPHSSAFVAVDAPKQTPGSAHRFEKVACVLSPEEHRRYWDDVWLKCLRRGRGGAVHQLLGYGDDTVYGEQDLGDEALVAFDTDDRADMNWGDAQRVWLLMTRKDLLARRFGALRVSGH